ncbi:conserved Plasmodium protein, unknown function [Plasmodium gallinaceum]|uniref:Uncharacterized protein n=1 Tax=Plasmodium gallinaceum TaxID=5849 RepID=A0A1J1GQN9_PLAGA|nr:conserved Plasmodium protein, unknown function [Plasmodium gallinaceum]CRG94853.1 conserved Plasmodium protein, unknown function [Plasmodium gallinaceum]
MIRKRKSKIAEDEHLEENEEIMEGNFLFNKKNSTMKSIEEVVDENMEGENIEFKPMEELEKHKDSNKSIENNKEIKSNDNIESIKDNVNVKNDLELEHTYSTNIPDVNILENNTNEKHEINEVKFKAIDDLYNKYDKEVQSLLESFELLNFSELFKNPFDPTITRDEKIVRIFYFSGFSFLPYLGWVVASIYGSFCKEKNNKNIISLRIISSIQCAIFGLIIILIIALINLNGQNVLQCRNEGISFKKKLVNDAKYNVVFFGPMSTDDWMKSKLLKITEELKFNIYTISYPNLKHHTIKTKRHVFLKDALACARLKYSDVILFSFQIESAFNFTIPFLEKNEILGFFSFSKKFQKKIPTKENIGKENIIYLAPKEKNVYDIYSSITMRLCHDKNNNYYNILYIVHHSFNKYQIRCSKNLAEDYSIAVNNFNFNAIGTEEKASKYEDDDFKEVIDDFYQYLVFIRDVISQNNLEFYRKMLCNNVMCESKGAICVL